MARFPVNAPRDRVLKALERLGFRLVREGNHIAMVRENADGTRTPLTMPNHRRIKGSTFQVRVDALVNLILDIVAQEKEDATIGQKMQPESELLDQSSVVTAPKRKGHPSNLVSLAGSYTGKTVRTVTFRNEQHEVHTWKEAAQVVFEALRDQDQQAFEYIALSLIGRKRPYITRNKEELRVPGSIPNTSLYFETNLSANMMIKLCHTLVDKMGYGEANLVFETEE